MKTITYDDSLYCLVPIEPSENMLNRGEGNYAIRNYETYVPKWIAKLVYKAMLTASPTNIQPPSTQPEPNLIAADGCCEFD